MTKCCFQIRISEKTSGGYVDGYIDFDYKISDLAEGTQTTELPDRKELAENEFRQTINSLSKIFRYLF